MTSEVMPVVRKRGRPRGISQMTAESLCRQQEILNLYINGMTLEQIGRKYGFSRQRAHQIVQRAIIARPTPAPTGQAQE